MKLKKKIAVFTGNRAEFGLQYPILSAINEHPDLSYELIVSGAHLEKNFGETLNEIEKSGFKVSAEIKIDSKNSSSIFTPMAIADCTKKMSLVLNKINPDLTIIYADRYEAFGAMIASTQMNIPTAHIEGGDLTEGGALDDSVRHAMTKLAHIHFTTNLEATQRLVAMGEEEWRVHTVGYPTIDLIKNNNYMKAFDVTNKFALDMNRPLVIFTQHSVTTEYSQAREQVIPSLLSLKKLAENGVQVIITYPNNDMGSKEIVEELVKLENFKSENISVFKSLGRFTYHGLLSLAKNRNYRVACVGNSSSGIKETPAFGCPTVNIGSRQDARLRGNNVIDSPYKEEEITNAIDKCFNNIKFRNDSFNCENPYGIGNTGKKIADIISKIKIDKNVLRKKHPLLKKDKI